MPEHQLKYFSFDWFQTLHVWSVGEYLEIIRFSVPLPFVLIPYWLQIGSIWSCWALSKIHFRSIDFFRARDYSLCQLNLQKMGQIFNFQALFKIVRLFEIKPYARAHNIDQPRAKLSTDPGFQTILLVSLKSYEEKWDLQHNYAKLALFSATLTCDTSIGLMSTVLVGTKEWVIVYMWQFEIPEWISIV